MRDAFPYSTWRGATLLCAVALVCAAPLSARADGPNLVTSSQEGATIEAVEVEGNRHVDAAEILGKVRIAPGSKLDAATLEQDIKRLWELGLFEDIRVVAKEVGEGRIALRILVVEAPMVGEIVFEGNTEFEITELQAVAVGGWNFDGAVPLRTASEGRLEAISRELEAKYAERGFTAAKVTYEVAPMEGRPGEVVVRFDIAPGKRFSLLVVFEGNTELGDSELRAVTTLGGREWFRYGASSKAYSESTFAQDLQRVTAHYYDKGYVQVRIADPELRVVPERGLVRVDVRIEEGPRFKAASVGVSGDLIASQDELSGLVEVEQGEWFSYGAMRRSMDALRAFYTQAGYAEVSVFPKTSIDVEARSVTVDFEIVKGPKGAAP